MKKYKKVVVGGTFDHLRLGHKALLRKAFEVGEYVYVGLTSDEMVKKKKFSERVLPYERRLKDLITFFEVNKFKNYRIIRIYNAIGFADEVKSLEAIVVSEETYKGALLINRARKEKGLKPLEIVKIGIIKAQTGNKLSSTLIRAGLIDPFGKMIKKVKKR